MNLNEENSKSVKIYTYKLYQYVDGSGKTIFRAKERGRFFGWNWICIGFLRDNGERSPHHPCFNPIISWPTREDAIRDLKVYSRSQNRAVKAAEDAVKRNDLKLVIIEDIDL